VLHLRPARPANTAPLPERPHWRCTFGQPMKVIDRRLPALQPEPSPAGPRTAANVAHERPDKSTAQQQHPMH
jgi:hypothetical protein